MSKFRDGLLGPSVILVSICFVITLILAFTYQQTKPVIEQADIAAANAVREEVLPGSADFKEITGVTLPDGVFEAYKGSGGYVFKSGAKGFDGIVTYMIGIDDNGEVVGINMFDHNETPGLGTKIADPSYMGKYYGNPNTNEIDAVTGATKTTNSLKNSLIQALEAFEIVKGAA